MAPVFDPVSTEIDFPASEAKTLAFWKERRIFERSLEARAGAPPFVFYEGPPTANGTPHNGHVLTRVMKDLFPRYRTMRGFHVPRKAGWDTHGLPVEVEVEKELRIHGKAEIERYGVEPFVLRCVESVFRYTSDWERLTERIGFWVDLGDAYVTYHRRYVESVWWALATLHRKGLLYRGHKVVWWWAQGGTALSSGEVGLGYRTVDDPSVWVAFPLRDDPGTALLVWTTTPWTLPSNMYAAVDAGEEYVTVEDRGRRLVLAAALREALARKIGRPLPVVATCRGGDLVGRRYVPPFPVYDETFGDVLEPLAAGGDEAPYFRVIDADFVTLDTGTGIVHIAPAFGEDDYDLHRRHASRFADPSGIEMFCCVRPDGTFSDDLPRWAGRWVKDADKEIVQEMGERGLLVHREAYRHDYPFCWRADQDPLIQYARPAWYIRTTARKDRAIENNRAVDWLPAHVREGRFGDFLANNVDWALSRERWWGTPLPLWTNAETGEVVAVASLDELRRRPGCNLAEVEARLRADLARLRPGEEVDRLAEHLIVHKPWIDQVGWEVPGRPGRFVRVPEVIDCWFDSGCMPFAQFGFPHAPGSREAFERAFPADFISEAIDQTRGWFYSLLMISTLLFDEETARETGLRPRPWPQPYRTCIVLGHVCDRDGKKESKSKGNYTPPDIILEEVALDFAALRAGSGGVADPGEGAVFVAREDLEGLDVGEGATVDVRRPGARGEGRALVVRAAKHLPRRVAVLGGADFDRLGLRETARGKDVAPAEVPRLAPEERVTIADRSTAAPGADAFRWFFFASTPPWSNTRHSLANVRALQKDFLVKLRNVYSFFTIYARIDGFDPAAGNERPADPPVRAARRSRGWRAPAQRALLDRWIVSETALCARSMTAHLDGFRSFEAATALQALVDALSNWYVRRSRERFWGPGLGQDKIDAYYTLWEALVTIAHLAAPLVPFFAEEMYQNLVRGPWPDTQPESVHLAGFPEADDEVVDEVLATDMGVVREIVSLGLKVRTDARLRVRQPLAFADVVLGRQDLSDRIAAHGSLVAEELNVHEVRFLRPGEESGLVRYRVKPNFRALGPRLGAGVQAAKRALEAADGGALRAEMARAGCIAIDAGGETVQLGPDDVDVVVEAAPGFAAAGARVGVVVLSTELTPALVDEGILREILSLAQAARKRAGLEYTQRIRIAVDGPERVRRVAEAGRDRIARETLAPEVVIGPATFDPEARLEAVVDGESISAAISRLA